MSFRINKSITISRGYVQAIPPTPTPGGPTPTPTDVPPTPTPTPTVSPTPTATPTPTPNLDALYSVYSDTKTYYANSSTGNDVTGDGSSGTPWKTVSGSVGKIRNTLISPKTVVTLQLADGTYSGMQITELPFKLTLRGNSTTPNNVYITGYTEAIENSYVKLEYLKVNNLTAYNRAILEIGTNVIISSSLNSHIYSAEGGEVRVTGNYTALGNPTYHLAVDAGVIIYNSGITATIGATGTTTTWGDRFALLTNRSRVRFHQYGISPTTWTKPGIVNGSRYYVDRRSNLDTAGSGTTYLPGSTVGAVANGGIYI